MNFNEIFRYEEGKLFWKERCQRVDITKPAGTYLKNGYLQCKVKGKKYLVHRIIYEMFNDKIPENMQIDHINRIKDDNRIENLRLVNNRENNQNKTNQSKFGHNITFDKRANKFGVRIMIDGKYKHFGIFENLDDAIIKRDEILKTFEN